MATTKYHGKLTAVYWTPTGGTLTDVSGASRQFGIEQSGNEIDVSTRDDKIADATQYLVDVPGRTASLSGLDTTPAADRTWRTIDIGDDGSLLWYPLGTGTGKPYEVADAVVTKASYSSPHDNAATWDLAWRINTAITQGTTA